MEKLNVEQLGRAGVRIAERIAYKKGIEDTLEYVSKFLDEDTIESVREMLLDKY